MFKIKNILNSILLLFIISGSFFVFYNTASAQSDNIKFKPQVTIPFSPFKQTQKIQTEDGEIQETGFEIKNSISAIGEYILSIYNYLMAITGLLATIVLMVSGIIWLTAAGNTDKISQAKNLMTGAITGLVLMLTSYLILKTINPYLVDFRIPEIERIMEIDKLTCCSSAGPIQFLYEKNKEGEKVISSGEYKGSVGCPTKVGTECPKDTICLKFKNEKNYSCKTITRKCYLSGDTGYCFPEGSDPIGYWEQGVDSEMCPVESGQKTEVCYYQDKSESLEGQPCGTEEEQKNEFAVCRQNCTVGWIFSGASGTDCGKRLTCCKSLCYKENDGTVIENGQVKCLNKIPSTEKVKLGGYCGTDSNLGGICYEKCPEGYSSISVGVWNYPIYNCETDLVCCKKN